MEEELITFIKCIPKRIKNRITFDPNIDLYTLGLYIKICYLADINGKTEDLYSFGKKEYIDKALQKLEKENYIKFNGEDLEILE